MCCNTLLNYSTRAPPVHFSSAYLTTKPTKLKDLGRHYSNMYICRRKGHVLLNYMCSIMLRNKCNFFITPTSIYRCRRKDYVLLALYVLDKLKNELIFPYWKMTEKVCWIFHIGRQPENVHLCRSLCYSYRMRKCINMHVNSNTILKFVGKYLQNKSIRGKLETASALSIIALIIGWNILIIVLKSCSWFPDVPVYNCFVSKMQDESQWPAVSEGSITDEEG